MKSVIYVSDELRDIFVDWFGEAYHPIHNNPFDIPKTDVKFWDHQKKRKIRISIVILMSAFLSITGFSLFALGINGWAVWLLFVPAGSLFLLMITANVLQMGDVI